MALPPLSCNGCRKCCLGETITLVRGDDPAKFEHEVDPERGVLVLKKGDDGNCVYLNETGCSIYGAQPIMCRSFDCRVYALNIATLPEWQQALRAQLPSLIEGRRRLAELSD